MILFHSYSDLFFDASTENLIMNYTLPQCSGRRPNGGLHWKISNEDTPYLVNGYLLLRHSNQKKVQIFVTSLSFNGGALCNGYFIWTDLEDYARDASVELSSSFPRFPFLFLFVSLLFVILCYIRIYFNWCFLYMRRGVMADQYCKTFPFQDSSWFCANRSRSTLLPSCTYSLFCLRNSPAVAFFKRNDGITARISFDFCLTFKHYVKHKIH